MREEGKAYDAFMGSVREGTEAEQFCGLFNMNKSARFEISMYGERNAIILAHAWCHRMHYFCCVWQSAQADPGFVFKEEHVKAYVEQPRFAAMADGLRGAQFARVCKLRSLVHC